METGYQTIVIEAATPELLARREQLAVFVEEFLLGYDPETMCVEEIDRWIERLGLIRPEVRTFDDRLRKNQTESNQLSV